MPSEIDRDVLDAKYTVMLSVRVPGACGRFDGEVIRRATARLKMASHEQAFSRGYTKLRARLVDVGTAGFPGDANTKRVTVPLGGFSDLNFT
eukprot:9077349-Pyramimonas_sp.AAC.1